MEMVLVVATALRFGEMRKLFPPGRYAFIRSESERETKMKIMDLSPSLVVVDMLFQEYYHRNREQCEENLRRIGDALSGKHL